MPSFNVISQNYLQRDLSDWVIFSINPDVCTYRSNFTGSFNISSACFRSDNIRYEIKRQKLEGILREDPGFREEWGSLTGGASDSYDKFEADVCSLATQMDECGEIPSLVYNPLFKEGSDLRSKVALLQEHGLIPKEFLDHVKLSGSALATRANIFLLPAYLKQKDAFLKRYPGTMFESNMRLAAAQVYRAHGMNAEAEAEIKDGLRADLRDRKTYQMLLAELQILYRQTGRGEAAALVGKAVLDTYRMYWVGDIRLLSEGVNPFLKEKGIL
ncbi:hypothetical protein JW711_06145 [Candidatus Woesearchaeota archaeon]|nr:hypothetical protein [Candidatus Woesearchaeota archaeon]